LSRATVIVLQLPAQAWLDDVDPDRIDEVFTE
jgi:hypothetical protein